MGTRSTLQHDDKMHENFLKDSLAGICGAVAKISVGHPFETIKLRLQTSRSSAFESMSIVRTAKNVIRFEGFPALYSGVSFAVPGMLVYSSALFSTNGYFCDRFAEMRGLASANQLSLPDIAIAGMAAGAVTNLLHSPLELMRCRMQSGAHASSIECLKYTLNFGGSPLQAIYKGLSLTLLREIPANALYFATYNAVLRAWHPSLAVSTHDRVHNNVPALDVAIAGGLAGCANWLLVIPIDVLKSRWQTDLLTRPQFTSILHCALDTWRRQGIVGFFSGFSACMLRAFCANAATFVAVEGVQRFFSDGFPTNDTRSVVRVFDDSNL